MLFAVIVNLYASRLLLASLGVEDYGVYNIIGGVVALMMFVNTAMQTSTVRFITYSIGNSTQEKLKSVVNSAIHIHFWIMILILVAAETFGLWFINTKLNLPSDSIIAVNWLYQFSVLTSCVTVLQVPFTSLVISYERMDVYALIEVLNVVLKCGIIFLLPLSQNRLIAYAILLFAVGLTVFSLYAIYCKIRIDTFAVKRKIEYEVAKPMLVFAMWSLFGNGTYAVSRQGTNILINRFFGVVANAAGGVATQASSMVSQFVSTVQSAFNPQIIKSYSAGDLNRMRDLLIKESEIMLLLSALAFTPLYINMDFIMGLWLKEVPEYAVVFCQILLLCNVVQMLTNIQAVAIQATGRNKFFSFIIGLINLISIVFVYICFKAQLDASYAYIVYLFAFVSKLIVETVLINRYIRDVQVYKIMLGNVKPICILSFSFVCSLLLTRYISSDWASLFISLIFNAVIMAILTFILYPRYRKTLQVIYEKKIKRIFDIIKHPSALIYPNSYSHKVFLDYLRANGARIGKNTRFISPHLCSIDPGRLDYIEIGDNCCFSVVSILAHDYSWYTLLESCNDMLPDSGGSVKIGNNCFIGYQALVLKGTTIGDNVIIGARSVVKGNIPSNTVWAGIPAKQICTIEEFYQKKVKQRLVDAFYRRDHIRETKEREPSIKEMGMFGYLFLERTEDNYNKYIRDIEINGVKDSEIVKNYFFSSEPKFLSFEDFLNSKPCVSGKNAGTNLKR